VWVLVAGERASWTEGGGGGLEQRRPTRRRSNEHPPLAVTAADGQAGIVLMRMQRGCSGARCTRAHAANVAMVARLHKKRTRATPKAPPRRRRRRRPADPRPAVHSQKRRAQTWSARAARGQAGSEEGRVSAARLPLPPAAAAASARRVRASQCRHAQSWSWRDCGSHSVQQLPPTSAAPARESWDEPARLLRSAFLHSSDRTNSTHNAASAAASGGCVCVCVCVCGAASWSGGLCWHAATLLARRPRRTPAGCRLTARRRCEVQVQKQKSIGHCLPGHVIQCVCACAQCRTFSTPKTKVCGRRPPLPGKSRKSGKACIDRSCGAPPFPLYTSSAPQMPPSLSKSPPAGEEKRKQATLPRRRPTLPLSRAGPSGRRSARGPARPGRPRTG